MSKLLDFAALDAMVRQLERGGDAAEIHGSLCGALCVQRPEDIDLFRLVDAGVPAKSRAPEGMKQARDEALVSLQDEDMGFAPLLPDDNHSLDMRVAAMSAWCAGFLYGLSLRPGFDPRQMGEDAQEILTDFTELTRASFDPDEDGELEEAAYAELVEYVRVGVQLIYMELRPDPMPDPQLSRSVH